MRDARAEFDALSEEFYSVWFRFHPDRALEAGIADYGGLLPAQDDDDLAALRGWLENLIMGLEEIDYAALDVDRRLDLELMYGAARVEHREIAAFDWRRRDPQRFLPVGEIYRLTLQPPEDLRPALAQLLAAVPEYLRQAQAHLRDVAEGLAPTMVRAAAREADSGRCYLRELARSPWLRRHCYGLSELESLAEAACGSLTGYRDLLLADIAPRARGELGCGADHLRLRLSNLHFMDCDPGALREPLARSLRQTELALAGLDTGQDRDPSDLIGQVAGLASPRDGTAQRHRRVCDDLRREIEEQGVVGLPSAALEISERLACPRPRRLGADYLARDTGSGTLYLPAAHPRAEPPAKIRARCLAKGWGGSHLLAFAGGDRARRMARRVCNGVSLVSGWNLYLCRRLADSSDGSRRHQSLMRRRDSILRAQLDLDLHAGAVNSGQAMAHLRGLGYDESAATVELAHTAARPGDALAGVLGWLMLEQIRDQQREIQGADFSERELHDRLVAHGSVPLPLVLKHGLGYPMWEGACQALFGGAEEARV